MSHQHYTLRGLRGGGATDHWLQCRDLPPLRRRGRWTSARNLERNIQEGTFLLHQNHLSKVVADRLSALVELAPRFFAEQDYEGAHHQPLQPPRCNGKSRGVHSVLRSGFEQRSFALTVSPLGALLSSFSDVERKQSASRRRTRYGHRKTGMDYVVSRVWRSAFQTFRSKSDVISQGKKDGKTVHLANLMDLCHLKNLQNTSRNTRSELFVTSSKTMKDAGQYSRSQVSQGLRWQPQGSWTTSQSFRVCVEK